MGDTWKVKKNFTLTYGLRYVRDTGRTGSNLPAIPQLNAIVPGLGNRVRQPNLNFAPQVGFAWDPAGKGKTSIRGGIGIYYENALWVSISSSPREATGAFNQIVPACNGTAYATTRSYPRRITSANILQRWRRADEQPRCHWNCSQRDRCVPEAIPGRLTLQPKRTEPELYRVAAGPGFRFWSGRAHG